MGQERFQLPEPFFVVATQNPLEMEGTFPLPEPELDRFFFKLVFAAARRRAVGRHLATEAPKANRRPRGRLCPASGWWRCGSSCGRCPCRQEVRFRATGLVAASQPDSPQAPPLVRQCRALGGQSAGARPWCWPPRCGRFGRPGGGHGRRGGRRRGAALRHRLMLNFEGQADGITPDRIVDALLECGDCHRLLPAEMKHARTKSSDKPPRCKRISNKPCCGLTARFFATFAG